MKVYFLLSIICFEFCKALVHFSNNGVDISYTITFLSPCRLGRNRFRRFIGITLPECVMKCGLRPSCNSLTFQMRSVCDLFESAGYVENLVNGACIYISSSAIVVQKNPCGECEQGQVCDVYSKQCIYKDCPVKLDENGFVLGNMHVVGSKVIHDCKEGFKNKIGEGVSVCQSNGLWSADAGCIRDCGSDFQITDGTASLVNGSTTFGSIAQVKCISGYETDKVEIKCQKSGKWETALCIIKDCGSDFQISNGTAWLVDGSTTLDSTAKVTCDPGYGTDTVEIKCQETGKWETAVCARKDCGSNFQITDGTASLVNGSTTFGSIAQVKCISGYETDKVEIKCQESGKWETALCVIKDCGSDFKISNGTAWLVDGSTTLDSTAKVTCDPGYWTDTVEIKCQETGKWETAVCARKDCGSNFQFPDGTASLVNGSTMFESTAKVICDPGYGTDTVEIKCQETGKWETAVCARKDCGSNFQITDGTASLVNGSTTFESTAKVICDPGYETDKVEIKCQESGKWETALCVIKDCGGKLQIVNGNAELIDGTTTFGSKANVICNEKHESEKGLITCLESGKWETTECVKLVYKLVRTDFTWDDAKVNCENIGGRLADIKSLEEHEAIEKILPSGHQLFWIGGRFDEKTNTYKWLDGTQISDRNSKWDLGQPDYLGETVVFLQQENGHTGYKWHDGPTNWGIGSVCEFD